MDTRTFGKAGWTVSTVGFGAMHLSLEGRPDREEALHVLHRLFDEGITFIDTADSYCRDESDKHHNERLIAEALDSWEGDARQVKVATKGGLMRPDGRWTRNGDPEHLRETIRTSAEILGRPIDLWQHHAPDEEVDVRESLGAAHEAQEEGLIEQIGVSNYSVDQLEAARGVVDLVSVQNQYSPWHRKPEQDGVLAYCEEHELIFLPYSPLGGRSRAKDLDDFGVLAELSEHHGVSPQRIVLAWLRQRSPVVLPIPGASHEETALDSVRSAGLELTEAEVDQINRAL